MCVFICVSLRQNYYTSHEFLRDNINIAYIERQKYVIYFGSKLRIDMLLTFLRVGRIARKVMKIWQCMSS